MIGSRLGPYEITAKLGEGGMGVVFKAKDFQLGREVALKVLPEGFTQDPERLARFEREAKLLAQLNHPNIAQIHGLEVQGDTRALVMELVEGPTLAERLEKGALPLDESLSVARQIAEALEEAHEKGIVHRDLKPQNVKASIEGKVKVLDFGLAKAMDPAAASGGPSASQLAASPTLTLGATVQGVILGTAAYMAPEQAKGLAVDKRADIWAFGVVLFEMLTGARLFDGDSVPETLAGVLKSEIDLARLPAETPPVLRQLLARCLERDARRRLRDIGEARVLLERPLEPATAGTVQSEPRRLGRLLAAVSLVAAALGAGGGWLLRPPEARVEGGTPLRVHLLPPEEGEFGAVDGPVTLSPDGKRIVFRLERPGDQATVAVRSLDRFEIQAMRDTGGAYEPGWSPDGRSILFFSDWLSKIDAAGLQPAQKLAPVTDGRGASWGEDGTILFAPEPNGVIRRVSAAGGTATAVTELDASRGEVAHLRPQWLPDREHFLFLVRSEQPDHTGIYVGSLDGGPKKRILPLDVAVRFVPPDLVLAVQDRRLVARRLDLAKLEIAGEAWTVAEGAEYVVQFDLPAISASNGGRLVYHPPSRARVGRLVRVDRSGAVRETIGEPGDVNLDLAPDGTRLATVRLDEQNRGSIWIRDLGRGVASRLSPEARANGPVWSPDGRSVAYVHLDPNGTHLVVRPAAGGEARVVWSDPFLVEAIDWSPDGATLLVETGSPGARSNLLLVPVDGASPPAPFAVTAANEHSGRFSPDGRWIAYQSDESGREQIFLEPLPKSGARYLVSPGGGGAPRWNGAGELLYGEPGERNELPTLYAVRVELRGGELALGAAVKLGPVPSTDYEPLPGGRELLATQAVSEREVPPPVLVDDWLALLPQR